jgi:hypothetical protein
MSDAKQLTFIVELEKSCPGIKCCKFELGRDEFSEFVATQTIARAMGRETVSVGSYAVCWGIAAPQIQSESCVSPEEGLSFSCEVGEEGVKVCTVPLALEIIADCFANLPDGCGIVVSTDSSVGLDDQ